LTSINLAVCPESWSPYEYGSGPQITHLDTSTLYGGTYTIRIDPHDNAPDCPSDDCGDVNHVRELDLGWIPCVPGDTLIIRAWIKTSPSDDPDNDGDIYYGGARIGCDLYTNNYSVDGAPGTFMDPYDSRWGWVAYSTSTWVARAMTFVVPDTPYTVDQFGSTFSPPGSPETISGCNAWLMCSPSYEDEGQGWFGATEFYVNYEGSTPPEDTDTYFEPASKTEDPNTSSWATVNTGRTWFNKTSGVFKYWDGTLTKTITSS
jgi:hypothetical protein